MASKRKPWVLELHATGQWFECDRFHNQEEAVARMQVASRSNGGPYRVRCDTEGTVQTTQLIISADAGRRVMTDPNEIIEAAWAEAEDELTRLRRVNAELVAALEQLMAGLRADYSDTIFGLSYQTQMRHRMNVARAVIAKLGEGQ